MPIEAADQLHLRAAAGYIELEMFEEAAAAPEGIDPFCRHWPEVLVAQVAFERPSYDKDPHRFSRN